MKVKDVKNMSLVLKEKDDDINKLKNKYYLMIKNKDDNSYSHYLILNLNDNINLKELIATLMKKYNGTDILSIHDISRDLIDNILNTKIGN